MGSAQKSFDRWLTKVTDFIKAPKPDHKPDSEIRLLWGAQLKQDKRAMSRALSCPDLIANFNHTCSPSSKKAESFPGLNYTSKTRDEFATGSIQGWSVYASSKEKQGGQDHAQELGLREATLDARDFWNKGVQGGIIGSIPDCSQSSASGHKGEMKVYSRRTRDGLRKETITNVGDRSQCAQDHDVNQNSEDHTSTASQSLSDSTSEYQDFDGDLEMLAEMKSVNYREVIEENGLEGLRHLMGQLELPEGGTNNTDEGVRIHGTCAKLQVDPKNSDPKFIEEEEVKRQIDIGKEVMVYGSEEEGAVLKVGKVGLPWKEIKTAMDSINLQLIENIVVKEGTVEQKNTSISTGRKKRVERELNNLKWTIEYDKGRKGKGLCSDP